MAKATDVFTPTDMPTITYVNRVGKNYEDQLKRAFAVPKMVVSISGPSKSGKTVLVRKVVGLDNLIHIYGASIKTSDDLWKNVITWMGGPVEVSETTGSKRSFDTSANLEGKVGVPFIAEAKTSGKVGFGTDSTTSRTQKFAAATLDDVVREIGGSEYVVFVDDFHYIEKNVREEIGRQIKAAAEKGVRICTASVPHRADDVVRSNTELRGRVTAIDMSYWANDELGLIAYRGFKELNVELAPPVLKALAIEACGSPQLMQAICLNMCFQMSIEQTGPADQRMEMDAKAIRTVLERTSVTSDFTTMLNALHSGPKQRGTERKQYDFIDGTQGDVYRCVLLALKSDPAILSFPYDEMLKRTQQVCNGDRPVGSSVSESLVQMHKLANAVQSTPVIEWDEDVLDIVEPYFLFFLRCSPSLEKLANG